MLKFASTLGIISMQRHYLFEILIILRDKGRGLPQVR